MAVEPVDDNLTAPSSASSRSSLQLPRLHAGSNWSLAAVMRGMTLEKAIELVGQKAELPQGLRALLQKLRGQAHAGAELRSSLRAGGYNTTEAKEALNKLSEQAQQKLDMERVQCAEYELRQGALLDQARREQDEYAAQAAAAKASILTAQASIDRCSKGRLEMLDSLRKTRQKCKLDEEVGKKQLAQAEDDIKTMQELIPKMKCPKGQPAALVQCQDGRRSSSLLAFGRQALRRALVGVRPALRRLLWRSLLQELAQASPSPVSGALAAVATGSLSPPLSGAAAKPSAAGALSRSKQRAKCTSTEQPTCIIMTDKMLMIQTVMMDKVDEMKEGMVTVLRRCRDAEANIGSQVSNLESRIREAQTTLAEGMTVQTQNQEESRLKAAQVKALVKDHGQMTSQCKANYVTFEHEICGLRKIRAELYAMSGSRKFIQDCEVSEWMPEQCNATCGGGVQSLKRQVVTIPTPEGAGCPPLQMVRRCSEQACPVDCSVGQWSHWSSCTANCGGGVRQRARDVKQPARHGGASCGQTSEVEGCNLHACDRDCKLASWSDWSVCSKACGGGLRERRRSRKADAQGAGKCPTPDAPERLEYLGCNQDKCEAAPGQSTLRCNSTLDVVILLQGSAGIRSAGWEAIKQTGELLARAFKGGNSKVGVVLFSGPRNLTTFTACSRGVQPGEPLPNMEKDCSIRWVSHLTADVESAAQKIRGLSYPRGTTLTSAALATSASEFQMGRLDARSAVIVISNGRVMSPRMTGQAADLVKERARLLWVPVSTFAKLSDLRKWVSKPVHENLIKVPNFQRLATNETINEIVSHVCRRVM